MFLMEGCSGRKAAAGMLLMEGSGRKAAAGVLLMEDFG